MPPLHPLATPLQSTTFFASDKYADMKKKNRQKFEKDDDVTSERSGF